MDKYGFRGQSTMRSLKSDGHHQMWTDHQKHQHQISPGSREPNFIAQLQAREENCLKNAERKWKELREEKNVEKRKATDFDLDLNLSLNIVASTRHPADGCQGVEEVEEIDGDLSLSLFSPSKKQKFSMDQNQGFKLGNYKEEPRKNPTRASTLDLTI